MANLLDRASVVLTPTAYNNGEALCIKPDDGSGDFDFSRNSAATRVNAQGLVENVQILSSNLVQNGDFSEEGAEEVSNGSFTNGSTDWDLDTGWSIAENKAVCDGIGINSLQQNTPTTIGKTYKLTFDVISDSASDFLVISTNFGDTYIQGSETIIGTNTFYITPTNGTGIRFRVANGNTLSITNISVKEVGMDWSLVSADASIGDNKLVCDNVLANTTIATQIGTVPTQKSVILKYDVIVNSGAFRILLGSGGTSTIVTTSGTYTFYETSGTGNSLNLQARSGGFDGSVTNISIIEITDDTNLPRINYENFSYDGSGNIIPNSGCGSWLFEPASRNLLPYSEDFSQWIAAGCTVGNSSSVASPSNSNNIGIITGTIGTGAKFARIDVITSSSILTYSAFFKYNSHQWVQFASGGTSEYANFDIQNGVVGNKSSGTTSTIDNFGNGWYRCTLSTSVASTPSNMAVVLIDTANSSRLEATSSVGSAYIWGAQLEQQSYATSYIPTENNPNGVSRNQDVCTNGATGTGLINSTSGVLYAEIASLADDLSFRNICINDASTNNRVVIRYKNTSNAVNFFLRSNNATIINTDISISNIKDFNKVAFKYKSGDIKGYINGTQVFSDTDTFTFSSPLLELDFNDGGTGGNFFGKTKCLAVFPYLSDAELISLTTI